MSEYEETTSTAEETPELKLEDVVKGFVDHQANAVKEAVKAVDALLPEGFKQHAAESVRETVRSYKVLADAGLEVLNRAGKSVDEALKKAQENLKVDEERTSTTGTTKVRVEVE